MKHVIVDGYAVKEEGEKGIIEKKTLTFDNQEQGDSEKVTIFNLVVKIMKKQ